MHKNTLLALSMPDFGIPKDMKSFIELQRKFLMLIETHTLLIYHRCGIGRTALVTTGFFIARRIGPDTAIQMMRIRRNGSVGVCGDRGAGEFPVQICGISNALNEVSVIGFDTSKKLRYASP